MEQQHPPEYWEVKNFLNTFFEVYYRERDYKKVCRMVSDQILYVGLGYDEVADDKKTFEFFVKLQTESFPEPIHYFVRDYLQKPCDRDCWTCYALIDFRLSSGNWGLTNYVVRLVTTVRIIDGRWKFMTLHVSESNSAEEENTRPFLSSSERGNSSTSMDRSGIEDMIRTLIPGGIITRYVDSRFTIGIVNKRYLSMVDYAHTADYAAAMEHSFLQAIHPDDVEKYTSTARFLSASRNEFECDYRIRRKDGSYLWVHDIGKKVVSSDGIELIISVITDISMQTEYRERLEAESEIDFLTNIYNRKGAIAALCRLPQSNETWGFFLIDLDNFKKINDFYGHGAGDHVLQYFSFLLSDSFGPSAIVCRMGGDEFAIYLPKYQDSPSVHIKLKDIAADYASFISEFYPRSHSTVSVGGIYGDAAVEIDTKYHSADANLYKVKNAGKKSILITRFQKCASDQDTQP